MESTNNIPKARHEYKNGKLWIFAIGTLYTDRKEAESRREKKHERLHEFNFFGKTFFGNVPKYDYKNIIETT